MGAGMNSSSERLDEAVIFGGGPDSGQHKDLSKLYDIHDAIKWTPDTFDSKQYGSQVKALRSLLSQAKAVGPKNDPVLLRAEDHLNRADELAEERNYNLAVVFQDLALSIIHGFLDRALGIPHGWPRVA